MRVLIIPLPQGLGVSGQLCFLVALSLLGHSLVRVACGLVQVLVRMSEQLALLSKCTVALWLSPRAPVPSCGERSSLDLSPSRGQKQALVRAHGTTGAGSSTDLLCTTSLLGPPTLTQGHLCGHHFLCCF